ncbi:hypothetical protein [Roseovarius rhodophyticola]|uniref:Quinol monooxygenase YgiN n=1 Tax=Roseovarius rhodophyticola TaxID=3080827 RepID=A0ABZ2TLC4_9RHOB|nr:hypothetical protein [Roseovarius sp. W115]MDV2927924.1 hypothetical protein [Roseovarius sp. W115]
MSKITEIFILKMKKGDDVDAIREAARADFVALEGVMSWETLVTTDQSRDTLYADIFTFPDHETAKRVTPQFAERPATQAFLGQIDEMIVGQFFTAHQPKTSE